VVGPAELGLGADPPTQGRLEGQRTFSVPYLEAVAGETALRASFLMARGWPGVARRDPERPGETLRLFPTAGEKPGRHAASPPRRSPWLGIRAVARRWP